MVKIKKILGFYSLVGASLIILFSFGNGPAKRNHDKTGSPLSDGTCMQCHKGGNFNPSIEIKMYDGDTEVTMYEPGKIYKLKYTIGHVGNPSKYGLQTTALNSSNEGVGTFDNISSGYSAVEFKGVNYVEHSSPSSNEFLNFDWTAPAFGTGDVTFYSGAIAANGNGSTGGDAGVISSLVIKESTNSSDDIMSSSSNLFTLVNNPVKDYLKLNLKNSDSESNGRIISQNGLIVNNFSITARDSNFEMNVSNLCSGVYFIQIIQGDRQFVNKFVKY